MLAVVSTLRGSAVPSPESPAALDMRLEQSAADAPPAEGRDAATLLGLVLDKAGIPSTLLDPDEAGLQIKGEGADAELVAADLTDLRAGLRRGVVVVPGSFRRAGGREVAAPAREVSGLAALLLARRLGGRCTLVKDPGDFHAADPTRPGPRRFAQISWNTARAYGRAVDQQEVVRFAEAQGFRFTMKALGASATTEVCAGPDLLDGALAAATPPLRVALLGCGTVGGGVYEHLNSLPELFAVTGVASRDLARARTAGIPARLLTSEPEELIGRDCDIVVELIGGGERAGQFVQEALRRGRHVVTANKALVAAVGERLEALASETGVTLRYSAAVGGALPAIETVARLRAGGSIRAFSGVLNGTTNFVLDRLIEGDDFDSAVRAAQAAGYAEADPSLDLDGTDAAQKLVILARAAFGPGFAVSAVRREGILKISPERVRAARADGRAVRLVASCRRTARGLEASVGPAELPLSHPLALISGAENRLLVEQDAGPQHCVSARGAGRWPTAESVLADLLDVWRDVADAAAHRDRPIVWQSLFPASTDAAQL